MATAQDAVERARIWPALPLAEWHETYDTLHLWTQVAGKIRLALSPMANHWWQTTLYVTPRGFTTSSIPYGSRAFEIDFDFLENRLRMSSSDGGQRSLPLVPGTIADFYQDVMAELHALGIEVQIWSTPVEVPDRTPFEQDHAQRAYDAEQAQRCWRVLLQADRLFKEFRGRFLGKASPVHFFWGAFDLAVTRFSGRAAALYSGGAPFVKPHVMHESYSHEVISHGWWPGDARLPYPAFYAYAMPEPPGFREAAVQPASAFYAIDLGEFILPYDAVRTAADPDEAVLAFMQSTYDAGAAFGRWDRVALEERPACPCDIAERRSS